MQLAVVVLLVVWLAELVNLIGKAYFTAVAYHLYLNVMFKDKVAKQRLLKKEVLTLKNELGRTSSQDEFAKWAKLRRKMDGRVADLDKLTSDLHMTRASFELKFKGVLWFVTSGLQFILVFWYRRSPVFYLPYGWFGPAEFFLALPFSERGSVSISVWFFFCRKVVHLVASNLATFIPAVRALKPDQPPESNNPLSTFASMAQAASGLGGVGPGAPGGMDGMFNPFAAMAGGAGAGVDSLFGGMGAAGSPGAGMPAGADPMFGPGSPFAQMFGQALGSDMMSGASSPSGDRTPVSGSASPSARTSSARGSGNLSAERRRRTAASSTA
ncbi:GET complex subunit get1 [Actinomortierella ambigua]|uniref:GET complex subunit get1 n=1 Tax=Actinomortierella ambigua TaxID=1343610 RepID=A0A9P6UC11_9FUNG|nr:GET complex subunit get1 [Actinomortierella ambigua]